MQVAIYTDGKTVCTRGCASLEDGVVLPFFLVTRTQHW